MKIIIIICLLTLNLTALGQEYDIPFVQAKYETTPVPLGKNSTDDTAIWIHPLIPSDSIILGTNKNKKKYGGMGGLGVYNLRGEELNYYYVGAINNIDLKYGALPSLSFSEANDIAVASNREKDGLTFFIINSLSGKIEKVDHIPTIARGVSIEPYGLCLYHNSYLDELYVFLSQKNGKVYQYKVYSFDDSLSMSLERIIDLSLYVTQGQDNRLKNRIIKELRAKDEMDEFNKAMKRRFQLEGCVADEEYNALYVGMENLGIWKLSINNHQSVSPKLLTEIKKSQYDSDAHIFSKDEPRLTDDVEGIDIYKKENGEGIIIVSAQGINEFALFNRKDFSYLNSFKITKGHIDQVTSTDGFSVTSRYLGPEFSYGVMTVHDDINTSSDNTEENANFKIVSFEDIIKQVPEINYLR